MRVKCRIYVIYILSLDLMHEYNILSHDFRLTVRPNKKYMWFRLHAKNRVGR